MRRWWLILLLMAATPLHPAPAHAEDGPNSEELHKMYASAMDQLKAAQERKNQLATENDVLKEKLAAMQKQLDVTTDQLTEAQRQLTDTEGRAYRVRAECAAWRAFLNRYPNLLMRWRMFLETELRLSPADGPVFYDAQWPLSGSN